MYYYYYYIAAIRRRRRRRLTQHRARDCRLSPAARACKNRSGHHLFAYIYIYRPCSRWPYDYNISYCNDVEGGGARGREREKIGKKKKIRRKYARTRLACKTGARLKILNNAIALLPPLPVVGRRSRRARGRLPRGRCTRTKSRHRARVLRRYAYDVLRVRR